MNFLTKKETIVRQIIGALPSPNFHLGKSYVKKINAYFLAICANFPCFTLVSNNVYWIEKVKLGIPGMYMFAKIFI